MATIGSMVVKLIADAQQFERQMSMSSRTLRGMERNFERTARNLERFGQSMMLGVTTPMALIGGSALDMAMDAVEAQNLFEVTMGGMADEAAAFSQRLRDQFGLATDAVNQQQAAFFRQFKLYGIGRDQALQMAQSLSMLTNDLGSFVNMDPSEVLQRLQSGLRGETDAVENLGIALADSIVKQAAYRNGIAAQGAELTETQKQVARYLAIMEQTADAHGDLARTIESPANQVRILRQRVAEAQRDFGRGLLPFLQASLPMLQRMATALNNAAVAFQRMNPAMREAVVWTGLILMATGPVSYGLGVVYNGAALVAGGLGRLTKFARNVAANLAMLKAGTASLGAVLTAIAGSKLRLVMIAMAGVAASSLLLIAHWDAVRAAAARVWSGISAVVLYAASLIVRGVSLIIGAFAWIIPAMRPAADAVRGWADSLKGAAASALNTARTAGTMQQVGSSAQQAAESANQSAQAQENLGQSMEDAAKSAGDNLQSFDQVHQIQEQMAGSPAAAPAAAGMELPGVELPGAGNIADMVGELNQQFSAMSESVAGIWQRIGAAWDNLLQKSPLLRSAVDGVNAAFTWIRDNWPIISPIVEGIAGVLLLSLVPALIRAGFEATATGAKMVAAWVASSAGAIVDGAKLVAQLALVGGKWVWAGVQAAAGAIRMAVAWGVAMGPVGWVITTLAGVVAAIVYLWNTNDDFRNAVIAIWADVKAQAVEIWGYISEWLTTTWQSLRAVGLAAWAWLREQLIPLWTTTRAAAADIWGAVSETLQWLWSLIMTAGIDIWTALTQTLQAIWATMQAAIITSWQVISYTLQVIWQGISLVAQTTWNLLAAFWQTWGQAITALLGGTWEQIKLIITTAIYLIRDTIGLVLALIRGDWEDVWERITAIGQTAWDFITGSIEIAGETIAALWAGIAEGLERTWNGIRDAAGQIWDGIVGMIRGSINALITAINGFFDKLSSIRIKIPRVTIPGTDISVGGGSIGMPRIPSIPLLADGGIITGPTMAVVGEAGPEAVVPLSRGGFADDLADAVGQAVYAAVRQAMQSNRGNNREEIALQIDGQRFARLILPAIIREGERTGSPAIRLQGV